MAAIYRFTDPTNDATVRKDISTYLSANDPPDWGSPDLDRGKRVIQLTLIFSGASKDALITEWRDIVREVERCSALEVRLDTATNGSVWIDSYLEEYDRPGAADEDRSTAEILHEWVFERQNYLRAVLRLVSKPYFRGAELTPTSAAALASAPDASNFVTVSSPVGDVEAPASVELVFDTTPNRMIAGLYRRTKGTPGNYVSILEAESATLTNNTSSAAEASASNGNRTTTSPANQNMNLTHVWAVSSNPSDRAGLVDVYVKIRDADTTPGRIKARLDLRHTGARDDTGDTQTITADADHDNSTSYELWYLGTYRIPDSGTSWDWRLHLQRTSGTAAIHVDYVVVLPVDESVALLDWTSDVDVSGSSSRTFALDTATRRAWWGSLTQRRAGAAMMGRGLWLKPNVTNRIIAQIAADTHTTIDAPPSIVVDGIASITIKYRPRFLWIR